MQKTSAWLNPTATTVSSRTPKECVALSARLESSSTPHASMPVPAASATMGSEAVSSLQTTSALLVSSCRAVIA